MKQGEIMSDEKLQNVEFGKKVRELSGEAIDRCYQCAQCSSRCLMSPDFSPRSAMRLIQLEDEEILESEDIWFCLTCFDCNVDCPHGIDLAKVFETLRDMAPDEKEEDFITHCERCGRAFLTSQIEDHLKELLEEEELEVNEEVLNHCPDCRQYHNAREVFNLISEENIEGMKT